MSDSAGCALAESGAPERAVEAQERCLGALPDGHPEIAVYLDRVRAYAAAVPGASAP